MDETFYVRGSNRQTKGFSIVKFEFWICFGMFTNVLRTRSHKPRALEHFTHWLNRLSSDDLLKLHHQIYAVYFQCRVVRTIHRVHVITIDNRMLVICRMENETINESSNVLNQLINMMKDGFCAVSLFDYRTYNAFR